MLCNLQIFSGCVCHLEQLHAQSPFLFPIVFSINLIPFFEICSVFAVLPPGVVRVCAPLLGPLRGRNCCCLWFWQVGFGVSLRAATSNLPSSPNPLSNRDELHDGRKHMHARPSSFHNPTLSAISTSYKFAVPRGSR